MARRDIPSATAILILRGRLRFMDTNGNEGGSAGCGSILVAYGNDNAVRLLASKIDGKYIRL